MEIWKDVVGFEGLYRVSNYGRIVSIARAISPQNFGGNKKGGRKAVRERIMRPSCSRYCRVNLCKDGKRFETSVHTIVLEAFVGPRPNGMQARHFPDRSTKNNKLSNLSWGTPAQNQADRTVHGTSNAGRKNPHANALSKATRARIRAEYGVSNRYGRGKTTQRALAKKYKTSLSQINIAIRG